jgi:hypothetical protein
MQFAFRRHLGLGLGQGFGHHLGQAFAQLLHVLFGLRQLLKPRSAFCWVALMLGAHNADIVGVLPDGQEFGFGNRRAFPLSDGARIASKQLWRN